MRLLLSVALVLLGAIVSVSTQAPSPQAPPQPPPRFRTGVDVIRIEVSVLDPVRQPLSGLTKKDFVVLQDGAPQEIVAFNEIRVPDAPAAAPKWTFDIAPDIQTNTLPEGRLLVLVLDDGMEPGPFAQQTQEIARSVVERLGPEDRAAVVFTRDNRYAQDFTDDRAKLFMAIGHFTAGFVFTSRLEDRASRGDSTYYRYSIDTIAEVAKTLADIPDRRKLLVYVGIGVPLSVEDATTAPNIGSEEGTKGDLQGLAAAGIGALGRAMRQARVSNVTVYSISSAGLDGLEAYAAARPGFLPPPNQMRDYLHTIAANTGGRASVETNDYKPAIERLFRENGSYYVIGYRATTPADDRKFRRVEVKVNRPGAFVRARGGFDPPASRKNAPPPSPLAKALAGVLPDDGIAMQVTAAPFAAAGKDAVIAIIAALRHPLTDRDAINQVDLRTTAYSPDGQVRGSFNQTVRLRLRPDSTDDASYEVLSRIQLKPGRYSLRIAAHNQLIGRTGSVFYDLVVPDFNGEALALSGSLVSATPSVHSAPKGEFATLAPIVPTSRREFTTGDTALAWLRVYQRRSGEPRAVTMAVRITDMSGSPVFTATDLIPAERFLADRSAEYRVDVPLPRLAQGEHLLTLEATAGRDTARRDVRFSIR